VEKKKSSASIPGENAAAAATRLRLTISYDGAPFAGWQSQAGGNGVQDAIEKALAKVTRTKVTVYGAGRTDAGVHALAQVAHFDVPAELALTMESWRRAINANLPGTLRILRVVQARRGFHARFSARGKIYRYDLCLAPVLPPLLFRRAWHLPQPLDPAKLGETLAMFVGKHDFRAFAANRGTPPTNTVREISAIRASGSGGMLRVTFEGAGFLYKMVRMLTGAAVRVAQDRESIDTVRRLLSKPGTAKWTYVAPADGLHLVRVVY
jgi:tRNA pseudouridine38-40 synthase